MTQVARVFVVLNLLLAVGFLFSAATILSLNKDFKTKYEAEVAAHERTQEAKDREINIVKTERDSFRRANNELKEENATMMDMASSSGMPR